MYGDVVLGVDHYLFEEALEDAKQAFGGGRFDTDLDAAALRACARVQGDHRREGDQGRSRRTLLNNSGAPSAPQPAPARRARRPSPPPAQHRPRHARSPSRPWCSQDGRGGPRHRRRVQRQPSTGERAHHGEFLINAQGEDVVAGIRTLQPLTCSMAQGSGAEGLPMEDALLKAYAELSGVFDWPSGTTARCRTSSSRSSAASSTSWADSVAANALPRPRSRSRWSTWRARG